MTSKSGESLSSAQRLMLKQKPTMTKAIATGYLAHSTSILSELIESQVLEANFGEEIKQLSVSPSGRYIAITTDHTTHVALLPKSEALDKVDTRPIQLRPKMIGPTTHVISQSPIATVLWHPLGADGNCLVTITEDAVVRLWELNFKDSWSFETPTVGLDLKKLASGTSEKEDFRPNSMNRNRGFSIDGVGMNVASASFGGSGSAEESPWNAMTLWIAMREGDVYALCPLLPRQWQPSSTTLASLSANAMSKQASLTAGALSSGEAQQCSDQYSWISDLDSQDPKIIPGKDQFSGGSEVYTCPLRPSVPKLQGPFQLLAEEEADLDLSDILVIAAKVDDEELMYGEDADSDSGLGMDDEAGLSASVVCLLTKTGRVYLCVDMMGVEGQWLPRSRVSNDLIPNRGAELIECHQNQRMSLSHPEEELYLTTIEVLDSFDSSRPNADSTKEWPTFSIDAASRYSFFVTHSQGVFYFNLDPWVQNLENELRSTASVGTAFRMDILANSSGTLRERILDLRQDQEAHHKDPTAAVILQDSDLGYFLLTAVGDVPLAAVLDQPDTLPSDDLNFMHKDDLAQSMELLVPRPPRSPYVPPSSLWERSTLPAFLDDHVQNRHKKTLKEEIRLSSATLDLMTHAHRVISQETNTLGIAAADLFRRCERLQDELRDQISRVREASSRIEQVIEKDKGQEGDDGKGDRDPSVQQRLDSVRDRQKQLLERFNETRRKFAKRQGKDLSDKERTWISDTRRLQASIVPPDDDKEAQEDGSQIQEPWQRLEEAHRIAEELVAHAKEASSEEKGEDRESFNVPPELRKAKIGHVMELLERESALVDATQMRLERLSLASVS